MIKETLNTRFEQFISKANDYDGSIITLAKTVKGMKYSKKEIEDGFNDFVSKNQYDKKDKNDLIEWLIIQTNK